MDRTLREYWGCEAGDVRGAEAVLLLTLFVGALVAVYSNLGSSINDIVLEVVRRLP